MKIIIYCLIAIYCLQVFAVIYAILTEALDLLPFDMKDEDRTIQSKSDVIVYLIPFFWVCSLIREMVKWWNGLK